MLGLVCFFMMLVFYLECGFSLLPNRKSFARGTPFLLRDVKKCQYFFINDLVHLNATLRRWNATLCKTVKRLQLVRHELKSVALSG